MKKKTPKITAKSLEGLRSKITEKVKGLDTIPKMQKETVRIVARHYIRIKYPEKLEIFDTIFEKLYIKLVGKSSDELSLAAFSSSQCEIPTKKRFANSDTIETIVKMVYLYIMQIEAHKIELNKHPRLLLDKIAQQLIGLEFNPAMVKPIKQIIFNLLLK